MPKKGLLKKFNESMVQDCICKLKRDEIFVELLKPDGSIIKGFRFDNNSLFINKMHEFYLYVNFGATEQENTYAIRFDLMKYTGLESTKELYKIAKEKLNDPDYKNKINQTKAEKQRSTLENGLKWRSICVAPMKNGR